MKHIVLTLVVMLVVGCGSDSDDAGEGSNTGSQSNPIGSSGNTAAPTDTSELESPPIDTKGFNVCGEHDGETVYCIPGSYCDDARTAYCKEGCNSDSDCSVGTSCQSTISSHKACLPDSNPDTAGTGSGTTYCGFKDGKLFTCNPGTFCDDPRTNNCEPGCLTEVNCSEGEYCDYDATTAFWDGSCVAGKSTSSNNQSSSFCVDGDQNCCCLNGEYFSCPSGAAVDACGGGDPGECLDSCPMGDFDCMDRCFELDEPDSSQCTRVESQDSVCN